jgi:hypothetical protein
MLSKEEQNQQGLGQEPYFNNELTSDNLTKK